MKRKENRHILLQLDTSGGTFDAIMIRPGIAVSSNPVWAAMLDSRPIEDGDLGENFKLLPPDEFTEEIDKILGLLEARNLGRTLVNYFGSAYPIPDRDGGYGATGLTHPINARLLVGEDGDGNSHPINVLILQSARGYIGCRPTSWRGARDGTGASSVISFTPRAFVLFDELVLLPEIILAHEMIHALHNGMGANDPRAAGQKAQGDRLRRSVKVASEAYWEAAQNFDTSRETWHPENLRKLELASHIWKLCKLRKNPAEADVYELELAALGVPVTRSEASLVEIEPGDGNDAPSRRARDLRARLDFFDEKQTEAYVDAWKEMYPVPVMLESPEASVNGGQILMGYGVNAEEYTAHGAPLAQIWINGASILEPDGDGIGRIFPHLSEPLENSLKLARGYAAGPLDPEEIPYADATARAREDCCRISELRIASEHGVLTRKNYEARLLQPQTVHASVARSKFSSQLLDGNLANFSMALVDAALNVRSERNVAVEQVNFVEKYISQAEAAKMVPPAMEIQFIECSTGEISSISTRHPLLTTGQLSDIYYILQCIERGVIYTLPEEATVRRLA
ncbi:hypothetical protein [Streptomyces sp. NPDC090112]|uniref:hypothetical protein n=1 Tax=Streptomyces sp. NPDC090112 TaxID=3365949 RepID=UPI003802987A